MDSHDSEFLERLQGIFKIEAEEHISAVTAGLIALEQSPAPGKHAEIIETVFREVHSLKGSARSVGLKEIESICHPMETVLAALKRAEIALTPQMLDLLHRCVDFITPLIAAPGTKLPLQNRSHSRELVKQLESAAHSGDAAEPKQESELHSSASPAPVDEPPDTKSPAEIPGRMNVLAHLAETVRIPTRKLDPLLYQAEELILAKLAGIQRTRDVQGIHDQLNVLKLESERWKDRLSMIKEPLTHEFYTWNDSSVRLIESKVLTIRKALEHDQRNLRRMVDEHLEAMKQVLMLPISTLMESFPKIVRDLSRDQGKEVDLVLVGGETEINKRVLENLKDPLIHILRNSVDHGMKRPAERIADNKPPRGIIKVTCTAIERRQVEIRIFNDGRGIDLEQVRAAAIKAGVLSQETAGKLSREETLALIFRSGVSTSPIITDISGRGLGMTIARERVEKLGGFIEAETDPDLGTTIRIRVPLTLATFRGVLVRVGESVFVLPTANVERVVKATSAEIRMVENRETITLDDQVLSVVKLSRALELPVSLPQPAASHPGLHNERSSVFIVVVKCVETRLGFQVDEILGEHQVLMKSLGRQLNRVRNIAGATILGTGRVILVLHVPDLMMSAVQTVGDGKAASADAHPATRTGRILAADDSITARTLIKAILENAGYQVTSALDGAEALALAKSEPFDLIVSDVDMPRLSGFELTTRIRADPNLRELPIVLVTALDSREDRERGIDAGANAYIVKNCFDQSNLLEVIQKLLY